jgi:hypothetical protein
MIGHAQGRHAGLLPVATHGQATVGLQRAADRGEPSAARPDYGRQDASANGLRTLRQSRSRFQDRQAQYIISMSGVTLNSHRRRALRRSKRSLRKGNSAI